MIDKTIGERIKQTLYEKRMTGFELASKAKISEGGTVTDYKQQNC